MINPQIIANELREEMQRIIAGLKAANQLQEQAKGRRKTHLQDLEVLKKTSEAMRVLQGTVSEKTKDYMQEFLAKGLHVVFPERNLGVEIQIGDRGSHKTATILIVDKVGNHTVKVNVNDGTGGGVKVIISFLLQVLVILNHNLQRVIFIDEYLSQVSNDYMEGLFDLLHMLIDEFQFKILLVTHDRRFIERADRTYMVKKGDITEQ